MGTFWTVWPLDEQMRGWLDNKGVSYPDEPSRFPTGNEIKTVLRELHDVFVTIRDNGPNAPWQASITSKAGGDAGPWTMLTIENYSGDGLPQKMYFEKGWESLIKDILAKLVPDCGPLVLLADTGTAYLKS